MANRHHCSNNVFPPSFFFLFFVFFFFVVFFFKDCPAGWLNPDNKIAAVNHQTCDRCPQSLPVSGVGAFYCFGCPAGWLKNNDGAAACIACLTGTQGNSEGTLCSNCSAGTYQPNNGTAFCLPCIPGMYSNQPMSIKCQICEQNKYTNRTLQTVCENCPEGKKSLPGSASCIPCDAGKQEILYSATPFVVVGGRCCWWYLTTCYFSCSFHSWKKKGQAGETCEDCAAGKFRAGKQEILNSATLLLVVFDHLLFSFSFQEAMNKQNFVGIAPRVITNQITALPLVSLVYRACTAINPCP